MAWPGALWGGTSNSPRTANSARRGRIQSPEILEHEASLLGGEPGQLFPCRIAQPGTCARRTGFEQRREVHAVARGGATGAPLSFVRLAPRERPAPVEQPAGPPPPAPGRLAGAAAPLEPARPLA